MRCRTVSFLVALVATCLSFELSISEGQNLRSRQPLQYGFRWLGHGWSAGYHHRDPGPNTDYYNPYTAHNSMLISKQPGYQSAHHQYYNHPITQGVPYSVYAPTSGSQTNWNYGHGQAQSINPTFVPTDADTDQSEDSSSFGNDDNDFDPNDMPKISSDPDEPGSIRVDEDADEDPDFEDSSSDDGFDGDDDYDDAGINATKTGYVKRAPESLESLDFSSYLTN